VDQHIARCPSCQAALAALAALRDRLRALREAERPETLEAERWAALEAAWSGLERRRGD
jgi:hypothetical protein